MRCGRRARAGVAGARKARGALAGIVVLVAVALVAFSPGVAAGGRARAAACSDRAAYPGDAATRESLARWMAYGAAGRGVPGELPVMAALVDSGLKNLAAGDSDSAGFFQMRVSIWNQGDYLGFPDDPALQLRWFLDQAIAVRSVRVAGGLGIDEPGYGEWVADVQRPAEQYRYRYQLRLDEARGLIGPACVDEGAPGPGPGPGPPGDPPGRDTTPPTLRLVGMPNGRHALARHRIALRVACPAEACVVRAGGAVSIPSAAARVYRLSSARRALAKGERGTLRLGLGRALRRAARRAIGHGRRVRAEITIRATDASGNLGTTRRSVRLR